MAGWKNKKEKIECGRRMWKDEGECWITGRKKLESKTGNKNEKRQISREKK